MRLIDENEMEAMLSDIGENLPELSDEENDGKTPTLNLSELFGMHPRDKGGKGKGKDKGKADASEEKKMLSMYRSNLNEKAREGKIDDLVGRDREIDRVIQILSRRQKNNTCYFKR